MARNTTLLYVVLERIEQGFSDWVLGVVCGHEEISNIIYKRKQVPIKNSARVMQHGC